MLHFILICTGVYCIICPCCGNDFISDIILNSLDKKKKNIAKMKEKEIMGGLGIVERERFKRTLHALQRIAQLQK